MSFGIYAVGYLILIVGLAYLAHLMHIPQRYIVALVALFWLGMGIVTGCAEYEAEGSQLGDLRIRRLRLRGFTLDMWIPQRSSFWILGRNIRS